MTSLFVPVGFATIAALRDGRWPVPVDPTTVLSRWMLRGRAVPPVSLIGIYRSENAGTVRRLVASVRPARVALWALDSPADTLAHHTVGSGPGMRPALLNRLYEHAVGQEQLPAEGILLVADDDVHIGVRHARAFVQLFQIAALDIGQPAHLYGSYTSWRFVRRRPFTFARLSRFVEQGPIIAFSAGGARRSFPLREDLGMGWGLEAEWARSAQDGTRLGIIDGAGMRHLNPVSGAYDRASAEQAGRAALAASGFGSYSEMQVTLSRWRPPARLPPWSRDDR